jgi:anti-anti-sigma factor
VLDQTLRWTAATTAVAHIAGDIDYENAETVFDTIRQQAAEPEIVVDLSDVTFIDSSGLSELVKLGRDMTLRLVVPPDAIAGRRVALTCLVQFMLRFPTVDGALAAG